jgi:hypothetical protein
MLAVCLSLQSVPTQATCEYHLVRSEHLSNSDSGVSLYFRPAETQLELYFTLLWIALLCRICNCVFAMCITTLVLAFTTAPEADKISSGVQGHTALDFAYVNADGTEGQAVIEGKTVST